jgi:hypothetical protein
MSLPVGSDIEALCGKCGDVWHVVAAKGGDNIVKVVCKQCGQQHRYKPPPGKASANEKPKKAATPRAVGEKKARSASSKAPREDAPSVKVDESKPPRVYKPTDTYAPGERITHPSFGTGVVENLPGPGKIQVFFPGGRKILALTAKPSTLERPTRRDEGGGGGADGAGGGGLPKGL